MKRTDTVTKLLSILLFAALAAYLGVYLVRSSQDALQTSPAIQMTVSESGSASGVIIREEQLILSPRTYAEVVASEGKAVARNAVVALAYDSEAALGRLSRIREVELDLQRAQTLLDSSLSADDLTSRDAYVHESVINLWSDLRAGNFTALESDSLRLRSLLFDSAGQDITADAVAELERELSSLMNSSTADTVELLSPVSGVFTSAVDGYEHLSPDSLSPLTVGALKALLSAEKEDTSSAVGKVVSSFKWYYAALMSVGDADKLAVGDTVSMDLGRYYPVPLDMYVVSKSGAEGGECALVFSCGSALAETLTLRGISAVAVFCEHTGLRIPKAALCTDADGQHFVYVVTGMQAERKDVSIIYETNEFYLVESEGANALRAGNEIIVDTETLFDGKILG